MCVLPNFSAQDLEDFRRKRKKETKKAAAETLELIMPRLLSKNSI
jgi:hypothetical protein